MFDVFYKGNKKPGVFPHEQRADTLLDARNHSRTEFFWYISSDYTYENFDFNWQPPKWQAHQLHIFPSQWQRNSGVFFVPKSFDYLTAQYNYRNEQHVTRKANTTFWYVPDNVDPTSIDYTWHPSEDDRGATTYSYIFGTQWQTAGGAVYKEPLGGVDKFVDEVRATAIVANKDKWDIPAHIDTDTLDYSWHPNPLDPPYNYHFAVKWGWNRIGGPVYKVPGATEVKHLDIVIADTKSNKEYWDIPDNIDPASIDYTWCPHPEDEPYNYHFPVSWGWERTGGPVYRVPGATEDKYVDDFYAKTIADMSKWVVPDNVDNTSFDFSWRPHPDDPPYIYKFPTVWNAVGGPEYHVPGATEIKYIDVLVAKTLPDRTNWVVPEEVNADAIDFSWVPHPQDPPYIYHFESEHQKSVGLTYVVPGATEVKFAGEIPFIKDEVKKLQVLDIFFVDKNNASSAKRFAALQEKYPNAQKIRYANSMIETIKRCLARSKTSKFWVVSSENIYTDFNFEWHAQPWQSFMTHVFGSQWQKWSDTFLINKWEFERNAKWAKSLEEFPNLNFVNDQPVYVPDDIYDIYFVDHMNPESQQQFDKIKTRYPNIKSTRYVDNYLDTFKRIMSTAMTEYIWIVNSVDDYTRFDFTWQPEPWQAKMLHVFPSDGQEFGDTFYVHVPSFKEQMDKLELLEWFETTNFCKDQTVPRLPMDVVEYETDSIVDAVKNYQFKAPYALFKPPYSTLKSAPYTPTLWRPKDRAIHVLCKSGGIAVVPRDVKNVLDTQMYDYPFIMKHKEQFLDEKPMDVVFISNGEPMAEDNWNNLLSICPHAKRSDGVTGREAAYKAAARLSDTPWFFAVFAKTEVLPTFKFDFQPDRLQEPKHYIFHSRNALNGLEYGAMNINLYNKQLVLDTKPGIDFTLSAKHAVIPICASISRFNTDPWITWRSAFREVLKLRQEVEAGASVEIQYRLKVWMSKAEGDNAEYCLMGANDANDYYTKVNGDNELLKLSFDWAWLQEYYYSLYKQTPWKD